MIFDFILPSEIHAAFLKKKKKNSCCRLQHIIQCRIIAYFILLCSNKNLFSYILFLGNHALTQAIETSFTIYFFSLYLVDRC